MMKKQNKIYLAIGIVAVVLIAAIAMFSMPKGEETIKIGVIVPLTGGASSYGEGWQRGVELAKEQILSQYGEKSLELIYQDSQLSPAETTKAAQKLINIDEVKAIIIGTSSETLAAAPIAETNKILLMTTATSPDVTNAGDYIFRINPSDLYQGKNLVEIVLDQGYDKIAILTVQNDYGIGITNVFKDEIEQMDGEVLTTEQFLPEGTTDFRTQLNKIKSKNPDAILIIGHENHYLLILKQLKELNIDLPLFSTEAFKSQSVLDGAGDLAEGVIFTTFAVPKTDIYQRYVSNHQETYGVEPFAFSDGFYDNTLLISEGLIKNNGDVDKTKTWLYNIKDWQGTTGILNYDENGDPTGKDYSFMVVENNAFVPYNK